jgi:hypothetical protein
MQIPGGEHLLRLGETCFRRIPEQRDRFFCSRRVFISMHEPLRQGNLSEVRSPGSTPAPVNGAACVAGGPQAQCFGKLSVVIREPQREPRKPDYKEFTGGDRLSLTIRMGRARFREA